MRGGRGGDFHLRLEDRQTDSVAFRLMWVVTGVVVMVGVVVGVEGVSASRTWRAGQSVRKWACVLAVMGGSLSLMNVSYLYLIFNE